VSESRPLANRATQVREVTERLRDLALDRAVGRITQQMADANLPDETRLGLLRQHKELQALKRKPLEPLEAGDPPAAPPASGV
jgi:hypothetical protein